MIAITNKKLASLAPQWAPFSGCTIIFERFGIDREVPSDAELPAGALHVLLAQALSEMASEPWQDIGFCALPPATYHVTVSDLLHAGNARQIAGPGTAEYLTDKGKLRAPEIIAAKLAPILARSGILAVDVADLAFSFGRIANRNNRVVVAELLPGPLPQHQRDFARLVAARQALGAQLAEALAITLPPFAPHVSLGYFANKDLAVQSGPLVAALNDLVSQRVARLAYFYGTPALYLFSDMAHYVRAP